MLAKCLVIFLYLLQASFERTIEYNLILLCTDSLFFHGFVQI